MRSLTKTGIRILSAKYRSILIKCAIINASAIIGMVGAGSAFAEDYIEKSQVINKPYSVVSLAGAAIYNSPSSAMTNINANFISNFLSASSEMENSSAYGGAIYNNYEMQNINGNFTGNYASTSNTWGYSSAYGGAIYNMSDITSIHGDFNTNYVSASASGQLPTAYGGAIYNTANIGSITGNLVGNYAQASSTSFTKAIAYGGAIYNTGSVNILAQGNKNLKFDGNYVIGKKVAQGGAIYNTGTVGLYAQTASDSITFTGTSAVTGAYDVDGIYNTGTLNINGSGTITPYAGTVNLYNVDGTGTTNIYGGIVNVAKDITQNNINVLSGATLSSTTNGASIVANDTFTNAGTVNMSGDSSKLLAVNLNNNGTIDAINVVTDNSLTNNNTINATGIEVGEKLTNNGAIDAVNLLATQITNNGNITTTDTKFGIANNNSGASLTVNGKVNSGISTAILINEGNVTINGDAEKRIQLGNSGTANFNGRLDAGNSVIQLVENDGGIMNFSTNAIESTANLPINVFKMNGGTVNIADGSVNTLHINQLNLTGNIDFTIDADLENEISDRIKIHDIDNSEITTGKMITIKGINLLSDATQDKINLSIFADDSTKGLLADKVSGNLNGLKYSTIYKYDALYDSATGMIGFTRYNSGTSDDFNPYLYAPSGVANTTAAMTTQIAALAMDKMDDVVHAQGRSGGDTPTLSNAWVRVMGLNDNVEFNNFENIDSKAMTVAAGVNTDKITCGDCGIVFGAYAGYIGGKQQYTENDIDQNGGYVGLSSALTLGDAFLTATVNGGLLKNKANNMYGTNRFNTLWLGTGLKAGYNYAITDSVVLQPNVYGGYTLVNTKDYTSVSGIKIATNNLNFFEVDPGLKLSAVIADGWTGSVQGKYAIVMDNGADITANDIALQNISPKNYFEYGIGIDKSVTDAFYLGAQINRHDGGRTGWNGSIEFRYKF